jgi:membrane fusion protein (multidrug efflux system)
MTSVYSRLVVLGATVLLLAGCNKSPDQSASAQKSHPPQVAVVSAHMQSVPLTRQMVGRLASTRIAQVRARVAGIIEQRIYTEGTDVKQGQVLFQIDPAPLESQLRAADAALAKARADAKNAEVIARRYRDLDKRNLLSKQDLDTAVANERSTAADVKEAEANVDHAKINLGYAEVKAPISGRAGRALVTEGALVGEGEATPLTTVEQIDPIYVDFGQSVTEFQKIQEESGDDPLGTAHRKATVQVVMPDGTPYPHPGTLDFSDVNVDPNTGTVSMRAIVPNPDHRLLPGMFVNVRLTLGRMKHAFLLPQAAVARDEQGAYVLVVNGDGKVERRKVETHGMTRTDWIVTGDLNDGDRVIVEGLQKVRPGASAEATPVNAPTARSGSSKS